MVKEIQNLQNTAAARDRFSKLADERRSTLTNLNAMLPNVDSVDTAIKIGTLIPRIEASIARKKEKAHQKDEELSLQLESVRSQIQNLGTMAGTIPAMQGTYERFQSEFDLFVVIQTPSAPLGNTTENKVADNTISLQDRTEVTEVIKQEDDASGPAINEPEEASNNLEADVPEQSITNTTISSIERAKRSRAREAVADIYEKSRQVVQIEMPTGIKIDITGGLNPAIIEALIKGNKSIGDLALDIYGKNDDSTRTRISKAISYLNKSLKQNGFEVKNLTPTPDIRKGAESIYRLASTAQSEEHEPLAQPEITLEESQENATFTNYEVAVMAAYLGNPRIREMFSSMGIPVLDEQIAHEMTHQESTLRKAPTKEEMIQIRKNIIEKLRAINAENQIDEIYDRSKDCVKSLLTYVVDLGDKQHEAFEILIKELASRSIKVTISNGHIFHIGRAGEVIPELITSTRWEKAPARQEPHNETVINTTSTNILEQSSTEDDDQIDINNVIFETPVVEAPRASADEIEAGEVRSTIEQAKSTVQTEKEVQRTTQITEIVNLVRSSLPDSPTQHQVTREFNSLTRSAFDYHAEKGHVRAEKGRNGAPRYSLVDIALISYLSKYDSQRQLSSRDINEVRKIIARAISK